MHPKKDNGLKIAACGFQVKLNHNDAVTKTRSESSLRIRTFFEAINFLNRVEMYVGD